MKKRNEILLVLAALIWGIAFVAQSTGGDAIGPFSFNCIRCIVGALALLPVIKLLDLLKLSKRPESKEDKKNLYIGGISCGIILCFASNLQQLGITMGTQTGKAGFLTACYIILVPIVGLFFKKKCGLNVWIGVVLTIAGLYLLCMEGSFSIELSDFLVMLCALIFSFHILCVDHFSPLVDGVRLSCIQFLTAGILSAIPMIFTEMHLFSNGFGQWYPSLLTLNAWIPILYAGVMSCGVAYTLQIVGQNGVNPTIASLLMSLESVFSVLAGWILLHEHMSLRALLGCLLIFVAVVLAQIPVKELVLKAKKA